MPAWFVSEKANEFAERVRVTVSKNLGCCTLVLPLLKVLGFRKSVDAKCAMQRRRHLTHGEALEALVVHLVYNLGKKRVPLYRLEEWMERWGVAFCYGVESSHFNDDRLGDALDAFLPRGCEVLEEVSLNLLGHFRPMVKAVHHDLTSVLFTGEYAGSDLVTHGYNGQRSKDKQVNVSVEVMAPDGLVLWGKPLAGKENGIRSFLPAVEQVRRLLGEEGLIFVTDRIFATFDNLWGLKQRGCHFDCPLSRKAVPSGWIESVPEEDFALLGYGSQHDPTNRYWVAERELTLKAGKGYGAGALAVRALVICSEGKRREDKEGREKALRKIESRLAQIGGHLNRRRYASRRYAKEQIDKALKPPFGQYVRYELAGEEANLSLRWWRDEAGLGEREKLDGKYVLVTDLQEQSAEELFALHKEQHLVESRHRNLKTDLALRPLWLQSDERIEALLYVYLIALMLYSLIEALYRRCTGTTWTARKVLEWFGDYYAHKVSLKGEGEAWLLEEASQRQQELLAALGLGLPQETLASL